MSWFSAEGLVAGLAGGGDRLKSWVSDTVLAPETLEKLTLSTPELRAARAELDAAEARKARVRDLLAGLLPWETADPEREILVEECREAILKLSHDRQVFFGPYAMPRSSVRLDKAGAVGDDDEERPNEESTEPASMDHNDAAGDRGTRPTSEQLEHLAALEPLPPLLRDFEVETHVGLIQRMLKEDSQLSRMQAKYGVGEAEHTFWRNYFFHCAFRRYEAGLSIDEIWSEHPTAPTAAVSADGKAEETIVFEHSKDAPPPDKAFPADPTTDTDAPFRRDEAPPPRSPERGAATEATSSPAVSTAEYDMVGDAFDQDALLAGADELDLTAADYELDELEAEIARELED